MRWSWACRICGSWRALRLLRSYHLLRDLRRDSAWFRQHEDIIQRTVNLGVFIFIVTSVVYVTQHHINPQISNYVDALYFTITTLTTTGFGDITLKSPGGRLLAVIIMVVGVGLFLRQVFVRQQAAGIPAAAQIDPGVGDPVLGQLLTPILVVRPVLVALAVGNVLQHHRRRMLAAGRPRQPDLRRQPFAVRKGTPLIFDDTHSPGHRQAPPRARPPRPAFRRFQIREQAHGACVQKAAAGIGHRVIRFAAPSPGRAGRGG